jgi:hypothetical protein
MQVHKVEVENVCAARPMRLVTMEFKEGPTKRLAMKLVETDIPAGTYFPEALPEELETVIKKHEDETQEAALPHPQR